MMIETERLILRPIAEGDAEDVLEYLKEPMVHCFACMKLNSWKRRGRPSKSGQRMPPTPSPLS